MPQLNHRSSLQSRNANVWARLDLRCHESQPCHNSCAVPEALGSDPLYRLLAMNDGQGHGNKTPSGARGVLASQCPVSEVDLPLEPASGAALSELVSEGSGQSLPNQSSPEQSASTIHQERGGWLCPICGTVRFYPHEVEGLAAIPVDMLFAHTIQCLSHRRRLEVFLGRDTYGMAVGRSWGLARGTDEVESLVEAIHRVLAKEHSRRLARGGISDVDASKKANLEGEYNAIAQLCVTEYSSIRCPMSSMCRSDGFERIPVCYSVSDSGAIATGFCGLDKAAISMLSVLHCFGSLRGRAGEAITRCRVHIRCDDKPIHSPHAGIPPELAPLTRHALVCWSAAIRTVSGKLLTAVTFREVCDHARASTSVSLHEIALSVAFRDLILYLCHMGFAIRGVRRAVGSPPVPTSVSLLKYFEPILIAM